MDGGGLNVLVRVSRNDGEKKKMFLEFHVSKKKKKQGTLKERLLASAVAVIVRKLFIICSCQ